MVMTTIHHYDDKRDVPKWYDGIVTSAILTLSAIFFIVTMIIGVSRSA